MNDKATWIWVSIVVALILLRTRGCEELNFPVETTKVTAVTYFHEKDDGIAFPAKVRVALDELNHRDPPIMATEHEDNGTTPKQHAISLPAAKKEGLPCLVVMAGDKVVRVVKNPTTEAQVLEAVHD